MSFFDRNRRQLEARGIDPSRLPPGQYFTDRFPVLHVGDVPDATTEDWSLRLFGACAREVTLSWDALMGMDPVDITTDIHCVTKWSKFDTVWTGVRLRDLFALADPDPSVTHVVQHGGHGYTTNLPIEHMTGDDALLTWAFDGQPLAPEHGFPVRSIVPHLYFWKSVKWVNGIEFVTDDQPGFWEQNGYHNLGDPFDEQRFWGD